MPEATTQATTETTDPQTFNNYSSAISGGTVLLINDRLVLRSHKGELLCRLSSEDTHSLLNLTRQLYRGTNQLAVNDTLSIGYRPSGYHPGSYFVTILYRGLYKSLNIPDDVIYQLRNRLDAYTGQ